MTKSPQTLSLWKEKKEVEKFWEEETHLRRVLRCVEGQPYVFYDGPPTANGKPHIGHVETRVIKGYDRDSRYEGLYGSKKGRLILHVTSCRTGSKKVRALTERTRSKNTVWSHLSKQWKVSGNTRACGGRFLRHC